MGMSINARKNLSSVTVAIMALSKFENIESEMETDIEVVLDGQVVHPNSKGYIFQEMKYVFPQNFIIKKNIFNNREKGRKSKRDFAKCSYPWVCFC